MCCRFVLVLLFMCVGDSKARIVVSFDDCHNTCYKKVCPIPVKASYCLRSIDYSVICQKLANQDHFVTVYLPEYRIPLFSAYQLDTFVCEDFEPPRKWWFIEPQLAGNTEPSEMSHECDYQANLVQAVNDDYRNTHYEKGHLNPASYHCDDTDKDTYARTATFTLTNAVPQDPSFDQQQWKAMEEASKDIMHYECNFDVAKRFFVTGVIPSDTFIPLPEHNDFGDQHEDYFRVNVPSAMWTAACCDAGIENEGFSFSYYGRNGPNSYIMAMPITRLLHLLRLNGLEIQIFVDNCMQENEKSKRVLDMLVKVAKDTNAHSFAKMYTDHALDQHTFWH